VVFCWLFGAANAPSLRKNCVQMPSTHHAFRIIFIATAFRKSAAPAVPHAK
jgi:hypothetical protein